MSSSVNNKYSERGPLGDLTVNIEFIIISIVQGAAITTLAASAAGLLSLEYIEYWPYILTGFLFAMFYWSEAIGHTLGFIDWPLNLPHTFVYYAVGFLEMIAFLHLDNPMIWFSTFFALTVLGIVLYLIDYSIIREQKEQIAVNETGQAFYDSLVKEHRLGLYYLTPLALCFNLGAMLLIWLHPEVFITGKWHILLVFNQVAITAFVLIRSVRMFKSRTEVLADLYGSSADKLEK